MVWMIAGVDLLGCSYKVYRKPTSAAVGYIGENVPG